MHEKEVQRRQKNSVSLVLRSGATPRSSILCFRNCVGPFFSCILCVLWAPFY